MKPRSLFPVLLFALVALATYTVSESAPDTLRRDDPEGREAWEFTRLRDPRTNRIPEGIRARELAFATFLPTVEELRGPGKGGVMAQTWAARGPNNQGGRTRALALDVSDPAYNTILAGGASGGLWRSTNGGASWTRTTSVDEHPSVTTIAQDTRPTRTATWYYGTGENGGSAGGGSASYLGRGVWKSTNGGTSWALLASTSGSEFSAFSSGWQYVYTVATDPSNLGADEVYAANAEGIFRSIDGGASWTNVLGVSSSGYADVQVLPNGVVYATLGNGFSTQAAGPASAPGIWRSPDGLTWTRLSNGSGFPESTAQRTELDVQISGGEEVAFFLANAPGTGGAVKGGVLWRLAYTTGTQASVWANRTTSLPNPVDPNTSNFQFDPQRNYNLVVAMKPGDPTFVIVGGTNLYRSTNGFATAATTAGAITQMHISGYAPLTGFADYPNGHPDHHAIVFYPNNTDRMLVGDDGGIRRTENVSNAVVTQVTVNGTGRDLTVQWTPLNTGYTTTQFYAVALDPSPTVASNTSNVLIGGLQDNGTLATYSNDASVNWRETTGGDGTFSAIGAAGAFYLSGSQEGGLSRHGLNMSQSGAFSPNQEDIKPANALAGGQSFSFVSPFVLDPANTNLLYLAAGNRLWRNDNVPTATTTTGWVHLTTAEVTGTPISAIGVSTASPVSRVYYGTENGEMYRLESAGSSATPTRTDIFTGKGFNVGAYVSAIAVNPANGDHVAVAFSNYGVRSVYVTTDAGATWTHVTGNLEQNADGTGNGPSVRWVTMLPVGGGILYFVGTSVGVYSASVLNGASTTWAKEGAGSIGSTPVNMIAARASDGLVAVATHGNGMYSAVVTALPVELVSFVAATQGRDVRLAWQTAAETNNAGFEVEHNAGAGFRPVTFVPGQGTTSQAHAYTHTVRGLAAGRHLFRLRQLDLDGTAEYSSQVAAVVTLQEAYTLSTPAPNPTRGQVRFALAVRETQPVVVALYDVAGRRVALLLDEPLASGPPRPFALDTRALPAGVYLLRIEGTRFTTTRPLIVTR